MPQTATPRPGTTSLSAVLHALRRAQKHLLVVPEDWAWIDAITGSRGNSRVVLHRMAQEGTLRRIRRGVYAVRSATGTVRVAAMEVIGATTESPYLVTAGRALQEHGLTDQTFRDIVVVVPERTGSWEWLGERVRYVRMNPEQIWGGEKRRYGKALTTMVASPERAILDSLAHPRWGVTLAQVTEALDRAIHADPDFLERLADAALRYDNRTLARRLGFLIEGLAGREAARAFRLIRGRSHSRANVAPSGSSDATYPSNSRWQVKENVSLDVLTDHRRVG